MQQALDALEEGLTSKQWRELITALREKLAQPEQEPVAWKWKERVNDEFDHWVVTASEPPPYAIETHPLYTAPRQWQGLTKKEFLAAVDGLEDLEDCWVAIEAKLKEKNG